jgi:hypothetical protein
MPAPPPGVVTSTISVPFPVSSHVRWQWVPNFFKSGGGKNDKERDHTAERGSFATWCYHQGSLVTLVTASARALSDDLPLPFLLSQALPGVSGMDRMETSRRGTSAAVSVGTWS